VVRSPHISLKNGASSIPKACGLFASPPPPPNISSVHSYHHLRNSLGGLSHLEENLYALLERIGGLPLENIMGGWLHHFFSVI